MKQYLSRKDAAALLGCEPQTISNYAIRGYFDTMTADRVLYVEKETFERFMDTYFAQNKAVEDVVGAYRQEIDEHIEQLEKESCALKECHERMRATRDYYAYVNSGWMRDAFIDLVGVLNEETDLTERCKAVFEDLAKGYTFEEVAKRQTITRERVRQLAARWMMKMMVAASHLRKLKEENAHLQKRCERQRADIKEKDKTIRHLEKKLEKYEDLNERDFYLAKNKRSLAQQLKRISILGDSVLSVRALNCCKILDVETVYDLARLKKRDILNCRNIGKKTVVEFEEYLMSMGLDFGMDI